MSIVSRKLTHINIVILSGILQANLPDIYRGKYRDPETAGALYAAEVKEIVEKQKREKKDVACFIHESMLSCAGQIVLPKGYVEEVYK